MAPRVPDDITLDDLHDELLFTEARLEAAGLLPLALIELRALRAELDDAQRAQRGARAALIRANARVAHADLGLDALVAALARELLYAVHGDRGHARYLRYFTESPHLVARQRAEKQAATMAHWAAALAAEPEPALQALAPQVEAARAAAASALEARRAAERARADLSLDVVGPLRAAAERLRRGVEAELDGLAADADHPRGWSRTFFA